MSKLLLGDIREKIKLLPDESVDLIVTDPPYKIVQGGRTKKDTGSGGIFHPDSELAAKGKLFDHNDIKFSEWLPLLYRVLKKGSHAYIMVNGRNIAELQQAAEDAGFNYQNMLVWKKQTKTPNRYYMQTCEFILLLCKKPARSIKDMGMENFFLVPALRGNRIHPSEKPVDLMKIFVEQSSEVGDTVLDPFMGSGSTIKACIKLKRKFIGIEIDKQYFDRMKKELANERS